MRQHEDDAGDDLIGRFDRRRAIAPNEPMNAPIAERHDDADVGGEERLQAVVVVAVGVVGARKGQEVAVGPVEAERHAHEQAGDDQSARCSAP